MEPTNALGPNKHTALNSLSFHDVPAGPLRHCQICNSFELELVIDLGHQPLCDSLLTKEQLDEPEQTYPLRLFRCTNCSNAQLDYVVAGDQVYHPDYPYRCGITKEVVEHHQSHSRIAIDRHGLGQESLVIDIGSNDGTLLSAFRDNGVRVLGVEPTNIARIAMAQGIETIQSSFTEDVAHSIVGSHGKASLVTATNVFAHMATMGEVIRGILTLLDDDGVFVFENHYLVDIIKGVQYDTIYHEHIRSYSLKALGHLFQQYGLTIKDAEVVQRYAGSIRVTVGRRGQESPAVKAILKKEEAFGLYEDGVYEDFRKKVITSKNDLMALALDASSKGHRFVGNSCPGRCSTLINFVGMGRDLMPYIAEQPTSLKLGLHLPGKHIPIVDNEILLREQPDYVVLLAWHYWEPIAAQLRQRGLRSKLVVPLPNVRVLESTNDRSRAAL